MELLTDYEWTFIRIATLLFLFMAGFLRAFYAGENVDTYNLLVSMGLFMLWLTLSKVLTNYIDSEQKQEGSISWSYVLFYYVAIPLILLAVIMMTGFFNE